MSNELELIQQAKKLMEEDKLPEAEVLLLEAITANPKNIDLYNTLMEMYFHLNMFAKVTECFKEISDVFPDLGLNSYYMVAENLMTKNAFNEVELVLYLAVRKFPSQADDTLNKILELYINESIPSTIAYNFIKENYKHLNLGPELCRILSQRLLRDHLLSEHKSFFLLLFNISNNFLAQQNAFCTIYFDEVKDPTRILEDFKEILKQNQKIDTELFTVFASNLLNLSATDEVKEVLKLMEEPYPNDADNFRESHNL